MDMLRWSGGREEGWGKGDRWLVGLSKSETTVSLVCSPCSYLCLLGQHRPCPGSRTGTQGMCSYKSGHPQQAQLCTSGVADAHLFRKGGRWVIILIHSEFSTSDHEYLIWIWKVHLVIVMYSVPSLIILPLFLWQKLPSFLSAGPWITSHFYALPLLSLEQKV